MKPLLKSLMVIIALSAIFLIKAQVTAAETYVFKVSENKVVSYEQMLSDLKGGPRLIFVGEAHGREIHHSQQFNIIKALNDSKIPLAVGLEMFTTKNQGKLDLWTKGGIPVDAFIKAYYKGWNVPWFYYSNIFLYMRDNKIPAIGLNPPSEILQKVGKAGFSSLTLKELGELPSGIVCKVDEKYMTFIKK
ncbi:MAG: ChaN family lipoprotein, partial [Deltaproteobacteria bacterium]